MRPTENDFQVVASAAITFWDAGKREQAIQLDELARRMNQELAHTTVRAYSVLSGSRREPMRLESPLEAAGKRKKGVK